MKLTKEIILNHATEEELAVLDEYYDAKFNYDRWASVSGWLIVAILLLYYAQNGTLLSLPSATMVVFILGILTGSCIVNTLGYFRSKKIINFIYNLIADDIRKGRR